MINSELAHVKTLEEFNKSIRKQQEEAHGSDYCDIHDAIKKYMKDCKVYMELGTHQGGTASIAMLSNPEKVHLVDIDMSRYRKFLKPIAEEYCAQNGIALTVTESDSTLSETARQTDMLVIDSKHHSAHMQKELEVHGKNTKKYIIAHDTSVINGHKNDSLFRTLERWGNENGWKVIEREVTNVGYTVLSR
jgi:cephalosporin hydroxylase